MSKKGLEFKTISFEDLYVGDRSKRLAKLYDLFDYLEFDDDTTKVYADNIEHSIFKTSQNSKSILEYVPNYLETIDRLRAI